MPAQWTAALVGKMHLAKVSKKQLAEKMGITPEYVSMVLNGHKEPNGAEQRFNAAVDEITAEEEKDAETQKGW